MAETSSKNKNKAPKSDCEKEEEESQIKLLLLQKLNFGPKKKLLIIGLGGFLCHRVYLYDYVNASKVPKHRRPDASYGHFHVYNRPYLEEFMKFCLERFEVGIWSSAKEWYFNRALESIMIGLKDKLLFAWDQNQCTTTSFYDLEKKTKPIFLKELKKVWETTKFKQFSASNTLLIDNQPYKALLNPAHTAIFPSEYKADDVKDMALGSGSELRLYLDKVAEAKDVPEFIKQHPFGIPPISPLHPHWDFYSKIIAKYG